LIALVQRVRSASVRIGDEEVAVIGEARRVIGIIYTVKFHFYRGDGVPGDRGLPAYDLDD